MEFQFHPTSGTGAVRSTKLGDRGQKAVIMSTGLAAIVALSMWVTVPAVAMRALRDRPSDALAADSAAAAAAFGVAESRASAMAGRARDAASLLSKIAFLYRVAPSSWPKALNPEAGLLAGSPADTVVSLPRFLLALEGGLAVLLEKEGADPRLAARTPSILPLATELFEPAVVFGPRVSPWTGAEEFFTGLELATPTGSAVRAPAEGTVAFTGRVRPKSGSRLWRYGNLVVLSHGDGQVTLFGHLAKIEVRPGQKLRRGERIGTVGSTGWVVSPSLHYELWRERDGVLAPTDPRFAVLDRRLGPPDVSLEKMAATSAPGPVELLPIRQEQLEKLKASKRPAGFNLPLSSFHFALSPFPWVAPGGGARYAWTCAGVGFSMTETFDLAVTVAYARWKRAVDLLVREVVRRHAHKIAADETAQAERRVRNLRRIVRKALSEYSRLQIARQ